MSPQALKARKGEETRAQILDAAVQQASEAGFESLTIGQLAARTGLSKSGLFAHFGSRLELQIATLDESARRFSEAVFLPALKAPRGLKRVQALFENWIAWPQHAQLRGGCPIQAASAEYDDQPGPMRDAIVERQRGFARDLAKAVYMAVECGDLGKDTDTGQFVFEMYGLLLAYFQTLRLLGDAGAEVRARAGFARLVDAYRAPVASSLSRPAAARR
jgi:AcrR family transcriptional regulator